MSKSNSDVPGQFESGPTIWTSSYKDEALAINNEDLMKIACPNCILGSTLGCHTTTELERQGWVKCSICGYMRKNNRKMSGGICGK